MKALLIVLLLVSMSGFSQETDSLTEKSIKAVIENLFKGMKEGDSALVHSCFVSNPTLQSCFVHPRNGKTQIVSDSLQEFLNLVGMPHEKEWNEVATALEIKIDTELMASAWVPYTFYLGGKYQHEGVDAFILVNVDGKWKITVLLDTRRVKKP